MLSSVFRCASSHGVAIAVLNNFLCPTWAFAAGFSNNNNNDIRKNNLSETDVKTDIN